MKAGKNGQKGALEMQEMKLQTFAHSANNRMFTLSR
jgi:hypothetical protein